MKGKSKACFVQDCDNALPLRDVGTVLGNDWVAFAKDAVVTTDEDTIRTGVKRELGDWTRRAW